MNTQHKKFLAIAAVVALHAGVITLMLAQHGCKSGAQKSNRARGRDSGPGSRAGSAARRRRRPGIFRADAAARIASRPCRWPSSPSRSAISL